MKKTVLPNILQGKSNVDVTDCSYDNDFRRVMNNELSARARSSANAESKARKRGPDVCQIEASVNFPTDIFDHSSSTKSPDKSGWFRRLSIPLTSIAANVRIKTPRLRLFGTSSDSDDESEIVKKNFLLSGLTNVKRILQDKTWKRKREFLFDTPMYEFEKILSNRLSPTEVEPYAEVFEESDMELNRRNLQLLNRLPQFSQSLFDEHFNVRDCCSKAMTRDKIGLLLRGTQQPHDPEERIQEHLFQIYSKIFLSPALCHKVVQKAVTDNFIIDIIYKRRVRLSQLFTIADSFDAEFPPEVQFFCVSLEFIFHEEHSKEKEAAGWLLRSIIYQILHSKIAKQIFIGRKLSEPKNSGIFDLSFLCKLTERHSAIFTPIPISPKTDEQNQTFHSVDTTHTNVNFSGSVFKPVKIRGEEGNSSDPFIAEPPQLPEVTVRRSKQHVFRYPSPVEVMRSIAEVEQETDYAVLHDSAHSVTSSGLNEAVKREILLTDDNKVVTVEANSHSFHLKDT